jgi:hypothetical protein
LYGGKLKSSNSKKGKPQISNFNLKCCGKTKIFFRFFVTGRGPLGNKLPFRAARDFRERMAFARSGAPRFDPAHARDRIAANEMRL